MNSGIRVIELDSRERYYIARLFAGEFVAVEQTKLGFDNLFKDAWWQHYPLTLEPLNCTFNNERVIDIGIDKNNSNRFYIITEVYNPERMV